MTQMLEPPRDGSPLWLDLAHVVAGAPTRLARHAPMHEPFGGHAAARAAWLWHVDRPQPAGALRIVLMLAAQAGGAALTAAMLMMFGLGPV